MWTKIKWNRSHHKSEGEIKRDTPRKAKNITRNINPSEKKNHAQAAKIDTAAVRRTEAKNKDSGY